MARSKTRPEKARALVDAAGRKRMTARETAKAIQKDRAAEGALPVRVMYAPRRGMRMTQRSRNGTKKDCRKISAKVRMVPTCRPEMEKMCTVAERTKVSCRCRGMAP